jgi:predicted anti-sigma-YlaC factor YlaD
MRCRIVRELLSRHLDSPLAGGVAVRVGAHVARCRSCAVEAATLERAWLRLGALAAPRRAPDDFAAVLLAVRARGEGPRPWRLAALVGARARAVAAAAVAAGVLVGAGAGVTLGRAAFADGGPRATPEALALSDAFGLLPFGSPAARLAGALASGPGGHE